MNLFRVLILLPSIFLLSIIISCTQTNATKIDQNNEAKNSLKSETVSDNNKELDSKKAVWIEIVPGKEAYELQFTKNGTLSYQESVLLSEIPVTYSSDGSISFAKKLIVSPPSPSGNYHLLQACESGDNGLCGAEFLVNKRDKSVKKVALSKYGVQHWVQWSEDEKYALFHYTSEGSSTFYGLNLETAESTGGLDWFCNVNLNSFTWIDNKVFQIQVFDNKDKDWECKDKPYWFKGDVSVLPKQ